MNGVLEPLIKQMETAIKEITVDKKWGDQPNVFADTILNVFRANASSYLHFSNYYLSNDVFITTLTELLQAMKSLEQTTPMLRVTRKIKNIWENPSGDVPGSKEDLKRMSPREI
jgi:hypothetical protein